jgi:hypothetical protein
MELIGGIKQLLHEDGLTIKGAQKVLREQGVKAVQALSPPIAPPPPGSAGEAGAAAPEEPAPEPAHEPAPARSEGEAGASAPEEPAPGTAEAEIEAEAEAEEGPEPRMPDIAPLPGAAEAGGAGDLQPALFADLPPLPGPPRAQAAPEKADEAGGPAPEPPAPEPPAPDTAEPDTAEPGRRPAIAPLPGARPPLTVALSRLAPGQVGPGEIAPLLARARALRARMDIPVADRGGRLDNGDPGGGPGG